MTARKTRLELFEVWKSGVVPVAGDEFSIEVWQKQPYTAARVTMDGHAGYGFSKVAHPDAWDADFGIELAVRKAIADAVSYGEQDVE